MTDIELLICCAKSVFLHFFFAYKGFSGFRPLPLPCAAMAGAPIGTTSFLPPGGAESGQWFNSKFGSLHHLTSKLKRLQNVIKSKPASKINSRRGFFPLRLPALYSLCLFYRYVLKHFSQRRCIFGDELIRFVLAPNSNKLLLKTDIIVFQRAPG